MAEQVETGTVPVHLLHELFLPPGMVIDGAVVELAEHADGTITADLRIPAPQA